MMNNLDYLAWTLLLLDAPDRIDVLQEAKNDGIISEFEMLPFCDVPIVVWVGDVKYGIKATFEPTEE